MQCGYIYFRSNLLSFLCTMSVDCWRVPGTIFGSGTGSGAAAVSADYTTRNWPQLSSDSNISGLEKTRLCNHCESDHTSHSYTNTDVSLLTATMYKLHVYIDVVSVHICAVCMVMLLIIIFVCNLSPHRLRTKASVGLVGLSVPPELSRDSTSKAQGTSSLWASSSLWTARGAMAMLGAMVVWWTMRSCMLETQDTSVRAAATLTLAM